jgi:hypothetical protein
MKLFVSVFEAYAEASLSCQEVTKAPRQPHEHTKGCFDSMFMLYSVYVYVATETGDPYVSFDRSQMCDVRKSSRFCRAFLLRLQLEASTIPLNKKTLITVGGPGAHDAPPMLLAWRAG